MDQWRGICNATQCDDRDKQTLHITSFCVLVCRSMGIMVYRSPFRARSGAWPRTCAGCWCGALRPTAGSPADAGGSEASEVESLLLHVLHAHVRICMYISIYVYVCRYTHFGNIE